METQAIAKYIRVSPRKLKLLVQSIKLLSPETAIETLNFIKKSGSRELKNLIKSVLANARQANLDLSKARFKTIQVLPAGGMKRYRAVSRGMAHTYKKRMSHIRVILTDEIKQNKTKTMRTNHKSEVRNPKS